MSGFGKWFGKGSKGGDGAVPPGLKGGDGAVPPVKVVPDLGDKIEFTKAVQTNNMSAAAKSSLDEIAAAYPGSKLADAGKYVTKQITFTRVAVVTGGVIVAIILIDPETGQKMAENTAAAAGAFVQPFIPSLLSSCIPLCLLLSMAAAAMMMFQHMR